MTTKYCRILLLLATACLGSIGSPLHAGYRVAGLACEYGIDPQGIDVESPRLFWRVESDERGQRQTAYRILVASSKTLLSPGKADLWDSEIVNSDRTTHVAYAGARLQSSQKVWWTVCSWDRYGQATDWAPAATWTMGRLAASDWTGRWIQAQSESESILMRRKFSVRAGLVRAVLHVSGLGHYELFLNNLRIGDKLLTPGWTNYRETALYDTIDLTASLQEGANAIGFHLGNGMYHVDRRDRFSKFQGSFGKKRLIADIILEYADGSREVIGSDESWLTHAGPITFSNIYGGEDYDARLLPADWTAPGFDPADWDAAEACPENDLDSLRGYTVAADPIKVIEVRQPVETKALAAPGGTLFDFGQNTSYMPRLKVTGPRGSKIILTPGELVYPDGYITRSSMGGVHRGFSWLTYTKGTDGPETWVPSFFYIGSRYFQTQAVAAEAGGELPVIESLEGLVTHSTAAPIGDFHAANPLLEQIRMLVRWAQRSNMVSVLTDCPHREKLGWLEQYYLNGPAIRYEYAVNRIYNKGMLDMADSQTGEGLVPNIAPEYTEFRGNFRAAAEWGAAFLLVPWQQYLFAGDIRLIEEYYTEMKRYFAYLEERSEDDILSEGLGDWYDLGPRGAGRSELTLAPLTATAIFSHDARILSKLASITGHKEDADYYARRAGEIRRRFNEEFYDPDRECYGQNSQAANAMALALDLAEPEHREGVLENLVNDVVNRGYTMTAGDIGFRFLIQALSDGGRDDVVYRMVNHDRYPGYGYQLKMGATAMTESWDASRTHSNNHFMLGHITEWFYGDLLGIAPIEADPGFKVVRIAPRPVDGLAWVEGEYTSLHGPIRVRWEQSGTTFQLVLEVPANTRSEVVLPALPGATVSEGSLPVKDAKGVELIRRDGKTVVLGIGSGRYEFRVNSDLPGD